MQEVRAVAWEQKSGPVVAIAEITDFNFILIFASTQGWDSRVKAGKLRWPHLLKNLNIVLRSLVFSSVGSKMLLKVSK